MSDQQLKNGFGLAPQRLEPTERIDADALDGASAPLQSGHEAPQAGGRRLTPARRQRQLAAVKHGLYVRAPSGVRLRSRRVRRLAVKVRRALPWLQSSDEPAVRGWCELEIVSARLFAAVLDNAEPGATDLYRRVKTLQLAYERELGMTPAARAQLGLTVAQSATFQERLSAALARTGDQL